MQNKMIELHRKNPKYTPEAYTFVMDALNFALFKIREHRHLSGRELSHACRELALELWGSMARHVLNGWGMYTTTDIGEIVFTMIELDVLSKSPEDRKEDFNDVFSFPSAFDNHKTELDEFGHVRRLFPPQHHEPITWLPVTGSDALN